MTRLSQPEIPFVVFENFFSWAYVRACCSLLIALLRAIPYAGHTVSAILLISAKS